MMQCWLNVPSLDSSLALRLPLQLEPVACLLERSVGNQPGVLQGQASHRVGAALGEPGLDRPALERVPVRGEHGVRHQAQVVRAAEEGGRVRMVTEHCLTALVPSVEGGG